MAASSSFILSGLPGLRSNPLRGSMQARWNLVLHFDRIEKAERRARRRWLFKASHMVQKSAKHSLKYRMQSAPMMMPPHAKRRAGYVGPLRPMIFFAPEIDRGRSVIGPISLNGRNLHHLEHGGPGLYKRTEWHGQRPYFVWDTRVFLPHPFMRPALASQQTAITQLWRDLIR